MVVAKIDSANNLAAPFTKFLPQKTFKSHLVYVQVRFKLIWGSKISYLTVHLHENA